MHTHAHTHMKTQTYITEGNTHIWRHIRRHTHTHACIHTHTHKDTHTHTDIWILTDRDAQTQKLQSHACIHMHTHLRSQTQTQSQTHRDTNTHACEYTHIDLSKPVTYTCPNSHPLTHTYTHAHTDNTYMHFRTRGYYITDGLSLVYFF